MSRGELNASFTADFGDLVEDDTLGFLRHDIAFPQRFHDVPRNRLALSVGVCRQVHCRRLGGGGGNLFHQLGFALPVAPAASHASVTLDHILGFKVLLNIDAKSAHRQVAYVAERRHDGVFVAQDALYGPRLRG